MLQKSSCTSSKTFLQSCKMSPANKVSLFMLCILSLLSCQQLIMSFSLILFKKSLVTKVVISTLIKPAMYWVHLYRPKYYTLIVPYHYHSHLPVKADKTHWFKQNKQMMLNWGRQGKKPLSIESREQQSPEPLGYTMTFLGHPSAEHRQATGWKESLTNCTQAQVRTQNSQRIRV